MSTLYFFGVYDLAVIIIICCRLKVHIEKHFLFQHLTMWTCLFATKSNGFVCLLVVFFLSKMFMFCTLLFIFLLPFLSFRIHDSKTQFSYFYSIWERKTNHGFLSTSFDWPFPSWCSHCASGNWLLLVSGQWWPQQALKPTQWPLAHQIVVTYGQKTLKSSNGHLWSTGPRTKTMTISSSAGYGHLVWLFSGHIRSTLVKLSTTMTI